ncbi:hypothetical protein FQR65_LT08554 [Abscondita terminalis]|nr:hypothetical protein FQR65_LT08554 [Abscondita terminalis]
MNNVIESSSSSSRKDEELLPIRRVKGFWRRENCMEKYDNIEFFERFSLTKPTIEFLLTTIIHLLSFPTNRGGAILPMTQLLLTLKFYATGSMLIFAGDFVGVSKTSACRIVKTVTSAIAGLRPRYTRMYNNNEEMQRAAQKFYEIGTFCSTTGCEQTTT